MEYNIRAEWDAISQTPPALVNQMQLVMGPDSSYGNDGIYYLRFGHVTPPMSPPQEDDTVLPIQQVGHFALSWDRVLELRDMLNRLIQNSDQ